MRLMLLGPLQLVDDAERRVTVAGPRQRVLLAALAVHANRPVSLDALTEVVWDGAPPPGGDATLRTHLVRLRRALGPGIARRIVTHISGYAIELDEDELDLLAFEHHCTRAGAALRAADHEGACASGVSALGLWRGEPLSDVPSQLLRELCVPRFERLRVQAVEDRIEAELRLGRHEQVLEQLRDLTASYPLRERLHAQLMLALAYSERRAEALAAYQDARRTLVDELGVEPGPQLRALHERILAGDEVEPAAPVPAEPAMSAGPSAPGPRQLPAAAGHFTGRSGELEWLTGLPGLPDPAGAGGTVVISAIDGMAGIGKTALAVHAAHRLADRFPDGQLFLDLHGYTKGHSPREPGDALDWLLRALGVSAGRIPTDTEARAALYRQRLADTRTLILLDNAANEAQVRPLLPGAPGTLVLATSRRRLKGLDDAHTLSLDLLPPADARALLRAVAGPDRIPADDPLLDEIARQCGYLPLALRIAGALLRHRPAWNPAHLAALLRDRRQRIPALADGERNLAAVFDLSYTRMGAQHQVLLRRLALIPGPDADAYAAAALLERDPDIATRWLEDLVDHNLLITHAPGRYRTHDLVRAHAAAHADTDPQPDRDAAMDRLLHYYAHTAQHASLPIARYPRRAPEVPAPAHSPALPDPEAARTWLRAERENLEAALAHARERALDGHVLALATGLDEILRHDGPFTQALTVHQGAVEAAERCGPPAALATALAERGHARFLTGSYLAAGGDMRRALEIYRAIGDRDGEAHTLTILANVRRRANDYPAALDHISQALEVYRGTGQRDGEAAATVDLGRTRFAAGDFPAASGDMRRALEIYRAIGRRDGEADALNDLAVIQVRAGEAAGAPEYYSRALEIYRAIGDRVGEARVLTNLGALRAEAGDHSGALNPLTTALEMRRVLGDRRGQASTLANLGIVHTQTGHYPAALDALTVALEIHRAIGDRVGEAVTLTYLGDLQTRTGKRSAALDHLSRALDIFRAIGNRGNEAWTLNYYAAAIAALGDPPRALALYQQSLAMNRALDQPADQAAAFEGLGECHLALGETSGGVTHLHQALDIFQRLGMTPDAERVRTRIADLATA